MYTTGKAARQLGVSPGALRRWADARRVAHIRTPSGRRLFSKAAIDELRRAMAVTQESAMRAREQ